MSSTEHRPILRTKRSSEGATIRKTGAALLEESPFSELFTCILNARSTGTRGPGRNHKKEHPMVDFTVEKIIEVQIRIIEASDHEEDKRTEGLVRDRGTLDFLVDRANHIDDAYRKAA